MPERAAMDGIEHVDAADQEVIAWAWKMRGEADLQLWIRGTRLRVYVPEQDRLAVAQSLARLAKAIHPEGALDDGET